MHPTLPGFSAYFFSAAQNSENICQGFGFGFVFFRGINYILVRAVLRVMTQTSPEYVGILV